MHEGHRGRLVAKIKDGSTVYEHELLEILLFKACPRRDLNATAHALISRFGGLAGVFSADTDELMTVAGVGKNMAEYICCLGKSLSKIGGSNSFAVLSCTADFKEFISARGGEEDGILLCMTDKDGKVRRLCTVDLKGSAKAVDSRLLKLISVYSPYGLFVSKKLAHARALPGVDDDRLVDTVFKAAKLCGTRFFDYCLVGADGEIYSYFVHDRTAFGHSFSGGYNG